MNKKTELGQIVLENPFDAHMHWRHDTPLPFRLAVLQFLTWLPFLLFPILRKLRKTMIEAVSPFSTAFFSGGLLMPNTDPKIITLKDLMWYRKLTYKAISRSGHQYFPIFTMYLTETLNVDELRTAWRNKWIHGVKYYPKGGTSFSDKGLNGFNDVTHILKMMEAEGIPLLIHGETPMVEGKVVNDTRREKIFMETEMQELVTAFPRLKISLEHISTAAAVNFVLSHDNVVATITPQHCLFDNRALYNGITMEERTFRYDLASNGSNPAFVCRPLLKDEEDMLAIRDALIRQARGEFRKFGLGTDTAPHLKEKKYCECGACGQFTAPIALQMYALAFEEMGILHHLSVFAGEIMPDFYGIRHLLPRKKVILSPYGVTVVQKEYEGIVPPLAGKKILWSVEIAA